MRQNSIPNFPDYQINEDGTIFCFSCSKTIEPFLSGSGYWAVILKQERADRFRYIHRLVLETFVGQCPKGLETRHLDGDRNNNHLWNLCWGTRAENEKDRKKIKKYFDATLRIFRRADGQS